MTAPALPAGREWQLALPLAAFFAAFFVAPLAIMFAISLVAEGDRSSFVGLANYATFFGDAMSRGSLGSTLWLGAKTTLLCLLLGYPVAWLHSRCGRRVQSLLVFVVILPLLTSVVVRTFAWIVILGRQGIVNMALVELGFAAAPVRLLYTETAVVVALAQIQLPLMVLPLMTSFAQIDPRVHEAATSLGASAWRTFLTVTLPLTLPGMLAGAMLVYAAAVTAFVTQTVVGGGRLIYMPLLIYQQAISLNNWPLAAVVSMALLVTVLVLVAAFNMLGRASRAYAAV